MKSIVFIVYLMSCITVYSQVAKYSYTATTSTWAYNSSPTAITGLGATIDDALSATLNIGFTFYYNTVGYTQFKASSNGFITFNTANVAAQPTNNLKTSTERNIVAPLWDDNRLGASGNVNYKLTGTTPNRVLTVEWKALRWNKYGFSAGTIDAQVKLYETTNVIEFVYNRNLTPTTWYQTFYNSLGIGASIGLSGTTSSDFMSISDIIPSATMSTTVETTTIGKSPTDLTPMTQVQANTAMPSGTTFRMTPPPIALPIELVSFTGTTQNNVNTLMWVTASERNNAYFTLERTLNGTDFEVIANINGASNSQTMNEYMVIDPIYNESLNYYRLKQTDYDGKSKYTDLISIDTRIRAKIVSRMVSLMGTAVNESYRGMVIIEYTDGSIEKIIR
jgi:hypothetical protein